MTSYLRLMLVTVAVFAFGYHAQAGNISEEQAKAKAQRFLQERHSATSGKRLAPARMSAALQQAPTGKSAIYVFNVGEEDGFVIVAGDDRARSILGYADSGSLDADHAPGALRELLAIYERQIDLLGQLEKKTDTATRAAKARRRISGTMADVAPLLTTTWDQGAPYNDYCPTLNDQTALTGCVATAMAQIANYHKYPTAEVPSLAAYTSATNKINVSAWGATTFDWDNMPDNYSGSETSAQKRAVATLMRYCGQAAQMDYGFTSGAYNGDALYAFKEKLGYNANATFKSAASYSMDGWENLIYKEVSNKRPVYYSALNGESGDVGGHAFVIDGYKADGNYFHVNWGWGGACNGYFNLFALDPGAEESPVTSTGWHYQMLALIGLSPYELSPWEPAACEFQPGKPLFLRHVATGQYLTGGNDYNTTTSLTSNGLDDTTNEPIIFSVKEETHSVSDSEVTGYVLRMDGSFTFEGRSFANDEVMRISETNCYVDRSGRDLSFLWKFVKVGNYYRIYTADNDPNFGGDGYMLGHHNEEGTIVRMISPDEEHNVSVDWEFVPFVYVEATGVTLDASNIQLQENDDFQLTATVLPNDARNKRVYWETDDESIATVDGNGLVHAVSKGTTVVRAITDDGGHEAECTVVVIEPIKVTRIILSQETLTIGGGEHVTLQAFIEPDDAQNKTVRWSVADATIAMVNAKGEVRGLCKGTTTVTATATDGSGVQASCAVTVLSDDTTSLETGWIIRVATEEPWTMTGIISDNEPANDAADHHWTSADYDDSSWQDIVGPLSSYSDFFEGNTNLDREWTNYYLRGTFYLPKKANGIYTIHAFHDDGMTMWINGQEVLNVGCNGSYEKYEFNSDVLVQGINTIAIHYWADGRPNAFDYGLYYEAIPNTYTDEQGLTYSLDAETMTATITGCHADVTEVCIPDVVYHCTVTGIADQAFIGAESLEIITMRRNQPWNISETTFTEEHYSNVTLRVPYEAQDTYREDAVWGHFQTITYFLPESYTDQQGVIYSLRDNSHYEVTGYDNVSGNIVIASEIAGIPVTVIGSSAFSFCDDISSVEIPANITTIGAWAFEGCGNLTTVTGMEGITEDYAWDAWDVFAGTAIVQPVYGGKVFFYMPPSMTGEYEMPAGIKITAAGSIRNSQLSAITLPASLCILGDDTFQDCPNLTDIYCYATTPPECVRGVWEWGFDRSACTVHVPASAVEDYQNAGEWNEMGRIVGIVTGELVDMTINVSTAGTLNNELFDAAVANASISDKTLIRNLTVTGSLNADDIAYLNTLPNTLYNMVGLDLSGTTLADNAVTERMFYATLYKAIKLPAGVTSIATEAFRDSRRLREVTLPETLKSIGSCAFAGSGLTSITIPDAVTEMGDRGVLSCSSLTTVTLGNGITSIPDCWAEGCHQLEEITIGQKVSHISWRSFYGLSIKHVYSYAKRPPSWGDDVPYDGLNPEATLHVYSNNVKLYKNADRWNWFQTVLGDLGTYPTYDITVNVAEMGTFSEALAAAMTAAGCEDMIDIGKLTVTGNMNQDDLYYLRDYVDATLDELDLGAVTMEGNGFYGDYTLAGGGFTELVLPATLENLDGWNMLANCTNLKTIDIPNSLKVIRPGFLNGATSLETVTGGNGVIYMENTEGQFAGCYSLKSPVILNQYLFRLPSNIEGAYEVPEYVTAIARDGMRDVSGLTALSLPGSINTILNHAFSGDANLKDIYFYAVEIPATDGAAPFDDFDQSACTLHVYEEMVDVFKGNEIWAGFNIVGDLGAMPNLTPMIEADFADLCTINSTLGGNSWQTKWITNKNVQTASRWRGVTFNEEGYVTAIDLSHNGLSGDISELTFNGLTKLQILNLSSNALTGDIQPLAASLPKGCKLYAGGQELGYVGEHTLYEMCQYGGLPSIAYWQSESGTLASSLIGVNGVCQFYHEGTDGGHYWDCYIFADGGTVNNFKFYWPSPVTLECFQPHHFTFTYKYDMGDANMDDALNALDLQTTLNYSNGQSWGLFNHYAADTYAQDGEINVQDIVSMVNILLAQDVSAGARTAASRAGNGLPAATTGSTANEACVTVEDGKLVLYTTKPVAALDLLITGIAPEALIWNIEAMGFATATAPDGSSSGTHAIIYSMQPREIEEGRTVLATFDNRFTPHITAAVLCDSKARPISVGHTVTTGIQKPDVGVASNWSLTDLSGVRIASGTHANEADILRTVKSQKLKGVFILHMDGARRKVMIK